MVVTFRAIKPSHAFQSSIFREEIKKEAEQVKKDMLEDFKRTVATWDDPEVKFTAKVETGASVGGVKVSVTTRDKRFVWTDKGTKKHIIRPKNKKALAFNRGYVRKTQPNVILSTPGGAKKRTGKKKDVVTMIVHHPGTRARNFTKVIHKSYSKSFRQSIKNALERAARRSGYLYGPHSK